MKTSQRDQDLEMCNNLPDDCPYFERFLPPKANQRRPLLLGDKLDLVRNDPAFAWNLACCYFEADKPMPAFLCRHVSFRAYVYLKRRGRIPDTDLASAHAVQQRPNQRDLWRAFLVTEASFEQIAAFLPEKVQVIRLFSALFWNVRPRLKDGSDLLRLRVGGPVDPAVALMQLAYTEGADRLARTVELANGTLSPESMPEQYERLERRIVSRANAGMDYGLHDAKSNPTLRAAQALVLARKRAEQQKDNDRRRSIDDEMGFGAISADKSCQAIIRQVTQQSAMEKLKFAQEYDAKQAAAAAAKKAVDV